ncbi:MAG: pitrilysin family protein [Eubacteriales bacterium]
MKTKKYALLQEEMYHEVLDNGLNIFMVKRPEFQKNFCFFATKYGGMDTRFSLDGKEWIDSPAGVAHYLEHKMFDTEDGNALQDLASNGASPNAFTANDITGYYFECTEKFSENLKILLSFVSIPWFTKESVEKEQGIIAQEIGMIEDNPHWCVYINLMKCLYHYHPARESVAGTVESIGKISAETLYACHKAFYTPKNMVLVATGNFEPEEVVKAAKEILPPDSGVSPLRDYGKEEPADTYEREKEVKMEVSAPLFQLGFKCEDREEGTAGLRKEQLGNLACEMLVGISSPLYAELYKSGLINQNFDSGFESFPGGTFFVMGGESKDPRAVKAAIMKEAKRLAEEGLDEGLWDRIKKGTYGSEVRGLNSFETICISQAEGFFQGYDFLEFPEIYDTIKKEEAQALLKQFITEEKSALSMVYPKGE